MWGVTVGVIVGCHCRGSYQCVVLWLFRLLLFTVCIMKVLMSIPVRCYHSNRRVSGGKSVAMS